MTPPRRLQAKGKTFTLQMGKDTNVNKKIYHPDLVIKNAFTKQKEYFFTDNFQLYAEVYVRTWILRSWEMSSMTPKAGGQQYCF